MPRIAILGASRGLGRALAQTIRKQRPDINLDLYSRTIDTLGNDPLLEGAELRKADFTKPEDQQRVLELVKAQKPAVIVYCAGGGPYGRFQDKDWKDHHWALQLNLIFPTMLAHYSLRSVPDLQAIFLVGSAVAEDKPDPMASSYAAAKHGLKGLCTSLKAEDKTSKVHIFSPPYMDTSLLPANAWPRQQGLVESTEKVAEHLWQAVQSSVSWPIIKKDMSHGS